MEPVERALDVAMIVFKNGGSTALADRTFKNVLKGYEQDGYSASWRLDLVTASKATPGRPEAVLRPTGVIGVNLVRVSEAAMLSERVSRGEVANTALAAEIARINTLAPPYDRWVLMAAAAGNAAVFSQLQGGGWGALGVAAGAAGVGQLLRMALRTRQFAAAHVTLVCGVLSACLAALGVRLGVSQAAMATLVSSVIYLIPGLPLINGFVDLVSHTYLFVGLERIAGAAYMFLILAVSIAFAYALFL